MLLLTSAKWNLVAPIAKNKKKLLKKNRRLIDFFFVPIDWIIMKKKLIDYASID
jgi:hypothetical protein